MMCNKNYSESEKNDDAYLDDSWQNVLLKAKDSVPVFADGPHTCTRILNKGEVIQRRYRITRQLGYGAFGKVYQAFDLKRKNFVAIKITRSKNFRRVAENELKLLEGITNADTEKKSCIVPLLNHFTHKSSLCLVLELQSFNLYAFLQARMFKGLPLDLISTYAKQICTALSFLAKPELNIIHGDLKPENIMIHGTDITKIKISDFGSACRAYDNDCRCVQTIYYRCPEVLLGLPYDKAIDMWSAACVLVEMHTGKPLFKGNDESDLLHKIIHVLGIPPTHILDKCKKVKLYFTKQPRRKNYKLRTPCNHTHFYKPGIKTLDEILGIQDGGPEGLRLGEPGHSVMDYLEFKDFIINMLNYNPTERLKPESGLQHTFVKKAINITINTNPQKWLRRSIYTKDWIKRKITNRPWSDTTYLLSRFSPLHHILVVKSKLPPKNEYDLASKHNTTIETGPQVKKLAVDHHLYVGAGSSGDNVAINAYGNQGERPANKSNTQNDNLIAKCAVSSCAGSAVEPKKKKL